MKKKKKLSSVSFTPRTKAIVVMNHKLGDSNSKISREYGMSRETVRRWLEEHESRDLSMPAVPHAHEWMLSSPRKARGTLAICVVCWESKDNYFKNYQETGLNLRLTKDGTSEARAESEAN